MGGIPPTLFWQIDGGPENANAYTIALCELLVAKRIVTCIYLTRLLVGHTHEDIDSKFGMIWTFIRNICIYTVQLYEAILRYIFERGKLKFNCVNLFAVPDYKKLLEECIDPKFGGYTKLGLTQLGWRIRATEKCESAPLGVETHYRAYVTDWNYEIVPDSNPSNLIGYKAVKTRSMWHPQKTSHNPDGRMNILQSLPSRDITPAEFPEGSRKELEDTVNAFKRDFPDKTEEIKEWEKFLEYAPQSDDVYAYLRRPGYESVLHVPLREELFSNLDTNFTQSATERMDVDENFARDEAGHILDDTGLEEVIATESVTWSNGGRHLPSYGPRVFAGALGVTVEELRELTIWDPNANWNSYTRNYLHDICRARGLPLSGNKDVLVERLRASDEGLRQAIREDINQRAIPPEPSEEEKDESVSRINNNLTLASIAEASDMNIETVDPANFIVPP
mmetsp:Transcript_29230/g.49192  ORF Transcript_29230/g.49192 Transcript_29230/m.49192 type:complete len:450 (+) Transcript_29230:480-1829(+)